MRSQEIFFSLFMTRFQFVAYRFEFAFVNEKKEQFGNSIWFTIQSKRFVHKLIHLECIAHNSKFCDRVPSYSNELIRGNDTQYNPNRLA